VAIALWVDAMSTSQRVVTPCGLRVKAGMVRARVAGKNCVISWLAHTAGLSTLEMQHNKALYKFTLLYFPFLNM